MTKASAMEHFKRGEYAIAAQIFERLGQDAHEHDRSSALSNASAAYLLASSSSSSTSSEQTGGGDERRQYLEKALENAESCIACNATWSKGFFRRGEVRVKLGEFEKAIQDYQEAIALLTNKRNDPAPQHNPNDDDVGLIESRIQVAQDAQEAWHQLQKAEDDLKQIEEVDTNKEESQKSVEELTRAAEERDRDPETKAALEHALDHMKSGQMDHALTHLKHALRLEPTCYQASLQCGTIFANKGDNEVALEYFQQAIQSQPGCLSAYIMCSQVLERMRRLDEAEQVLKSIVGAAFDFPQGWSALSLNLLRQGKIQEGVDLLTYALSGGPYGKFKNPSKDNMVLFCLGFLKSILGYIAEPCSLFMRICQTDASPTTLYMMFQMCCLAQDFQMSSTALSNLCKTYETSSLAFCSEMMVFNSTFDLPQWMDLSDKWAIFRCLKSEPMSSERMLPALFIPEDSAQVKGGAEDEGQNQDYWILTGQGSNRSKLLRHGELHSELHALKGALVQQIPDGLLLFHGRTFTLNFYAIISSYEPLQIEYHRSCYAILSKTDHPEEFPVEKALLPNLDAGDESTEILDQLEVVDWLSSIEKEAHHLWAGVEDLIRISSSALVKELGKDKGQARPKRFSALGLPKIVSMQFVVDSNCKPWLVNVDRAPPMKHMSSKILNVIRETILKAWVGPIVSRVGQGSFVGVDCDFNSSKLYQDYLRVSKFFVNLNEK